MPPRTKPTIGTSRQLKARLACVFAVVAVLNAGSWLWASIAFAGHPALLGVALVIYGLGLRHAVDADHIAAIDNVTRKLMGEGRRPVAVGFCFALGHSTVVIIVAAVVAWTANALGDFPSLRDAGNILGTLVSSVFLLAVAAMNILVFRSVYRSYRLVRSGHPCSQEEVDSTLGVGGGLLGRLLRPVFRLVSSSWHMFPVGFLFGLGFDTATEVSVFGVSAVQAAKGVPFAALLVFPVLFAAGMSLVDTLDGTVMLGAYDWAFREPIRKLRYNLAITAVSIAVALAIGAVEVLGLVGDRLELRTGVWTSVSVLNDHSNEIGFLIVGIFLAAWLISFLVTRAQGCGDLKAPG